MADNTMQLTLGSLFDGFGGSFSEEWRPVPGYEDSYMVSSLGNVWSITSNRLLSPADYHGYLHCCLCKNGTHKWFRVHRLVAEAFIPNPLKKETVNHLNENKKDNRVVNLEWATVKEQNIYGTRIQRMSEKASKKSLLQLDKQGTLIKQFESISDAEAEIGVDRRNLSKCLKGRRKTCGGFQWEYA